jgi:hypothetical protein
MIWQNPPTNSAAALFRNTPQREGNMTPKQILLKPREQFFHRITVQGSRFIGSALPNINITQF